MKEVEEALQATQSYSCHPNKNQKDKLDEYYSARIVFIHCFASGYGIRQLVIHLIVSYTLQPLYHSNTIQRNSLVDLNLDSKAAFGKLFQFFGGVP